MQPQSSWTNSIGSSRVMMCCLRERLIQLIIEARVVDLPNPVAPVTSTRPRCTSARRATPGHVGRVEVTGREEVLPLGGNPLGDAREDSLEIALREEAFVKRHELAVHPSHRW